MAAADDLNAQAHALPARPAGLPADFVWNPQGLNGQGAWTKPPGAPDYGQYAQYDASGKPQTQDSNGNWGAPSLDKVPTPSVGDAIVNGVKSGASKAYNALKPDQTDTSPIKSAQDKAFGIADALGAERAAYGGAYDPNHRAALDTRASGALDSLAAAANGSVPSAAEIQLRNQAARNAANSFGVAAALQGRSPGGALRQALRASTDTQAQTNSDAAALRANEMATARGQYVQAIQGQQAGEQGYRGQDITEKGNLTTGQIGAVNSGANAATGLVNANATNTASNNAFKGGIVNGIVQGVLSDEREKTDVQTADLQKLADALQPFVFKYKNPAAPGAGSGERVGVMEQDAEKGGPVGRGMVRLMPGGDRKGLDVGNSLGAALAMSAEALRRTRKAA